MRLKHQLFLILVLFSGVVIVLLGAINAWTLDRGFTNYVVQDRKNQAAPAVDLLIQSYQENAGWDWIKLEPQRLRALIRSTEGSRPPRDLSPPPPERNKGRDNERNNEHNNRRNSGRDNGRDNGRPRMLLLDANRTLLIGRAIPENNVVWEPLKLDDEVIGYWGIREPKGLPGELEQLFVSQQLRSYGYSAAAMVLLSALLAIALASRIVRPILNVNRAVEHITGGDYQHRVDTRARGELGDLSKNINQMALTLEKNKNARSQWVAEISHELRTPVAILQGELEALQDGVKQVDDSVIASLHAESLHLGRLINDLHELNLSDIGALNYRMEPVQLSSLLEQRVTLADSQLSQANLSMTKNLPADTVVIQGDSQRLAQMIDNLLQNSIRYTDPGGTIDITLQIDADNIRLLWTDSTPGVSDEQLPKLFESFYRVEASRSREFGGSGLGLSIVEKIVIAHQGSITPFHSDTGGLGIDVRLPL